MKKNIVSTNLFSIKKNTGSRISAKITAIFAILAIAAVIFSSCSGTAAMSHDLDNDDIVLNEQIKTAEPVIPKRPAAVAISFDGNENMPTAIESLGIESVIREEDDFCIAAHFPMTGRSDIDEILKIENDNKIQEFLEKIDDVESNGDASFEFNRDFESYVFNHDQSEQNNIISVLFRSKSILGDPVPEISLKSFVFDIKDDRALELDDFIKSDELSSGNFYKHISEKSFDKLKAQDTTGPGWNDEKIKEGLKPDAENFKHYYFDNESLVFVFDVYQLGTWSQGTPAVSFTLDEIQEYFTDSGLEKLKNVSSSISDEIASGQAAETQSPTPTPEPATATPEPTPEQTTKPITETEKGDLYVAITFDDGPHKTLTPKLLDILAKYEAKATFFLLGNRIPYAKDIVKRMADEGHEIGSHSYAHNNLSKMSKSEIAADLKETDKEIKGVTGKVSTLLRPPYGSMNDNVKEYAKSSGVPIILWEIDPEDWKYRDAKHVSKHVFDNVKTGSIILLHDIHETSVDAAEIILKELTEKGYKFITVSELLADDVVPGETYRREPKK